MKNVRGIAKCSLHVAGREMVPVQHVVGEVLVDGDRALGQR